MASPSGQTIRVWASVPSLPIDPRPMPSPRFSLRAALVVALGLGVAWASAAQTARGLDTRLDRIGEHLSPTDAQTASLDAIAARHDQPNPAEAWGIAAEVLTDAQIARLRAARDSCAETRGRRSRPAAARAGRRGRRAGRGARANRQRGRRQPQITDAQRDALRSIRDRAPTRRQSLVDRLRAGSISDQAFVD